MISVIGDNSLKKLREVTRGKTIIDSEAIEIIRREHNRRFPDER